MKDTHKERVIQTAIQNYKDSICFGFSNSTIHAIHMMEEARYMCAPFNIEGIAQLDKTIADAKSKFRDQLQHEL